MLDHQGIQNEGGAPWLGGAGQHGQKVITECTCPDVFRICEAEERGVQTHKEMLYVGNAGYTIKVSDEQFYKN